MTGIRPAHIRAAASWDVPSALGMLRAFTLAERTGDDLRVLNRPPAARRAGRPRAGTTHNVLLYHFDDVGDLLKRGPRLTPSGGRPWKPAIPRFSC